MDFFEWLFQSRTAFSLLFFALIMVLLIIAHLMERKMEESMDGEGAGGDDGWGGILGD